eukprot:15472364-Alexandrium_andersonii.AAC.1
MDCFRLDAADSGPDRYAGASSSAPSVAMALSNGRAGHTSSSPSVPQAASSGGVGAISSSPSGSQATPSRRA